jgi:hypothetical protein
MFHGGSDDAVVCSGLSGYYGGREGKGLRGKVCVICGSGSSGQWKTGELMADPTCMGVKKQKGFLRRTIFVIVWSCLRILVSYRLIKEPLLPA